jgi:sugar lactone lactonase YvrE
VDSNGNLYIADSVNNRVRIVNSAGVINTFAGTGQSSPGGGGTFNDGGLAINGLLRLPSGVCVDKSGNVYIADTGDNLIRKVTTDGIINTVAGDGFGSYSGDTLPAVRRNCTPPRTCTVDKNGNILSPTRPMRPSAKSPPPPASSPPSPATPPSATPATPDPPPAPAS